GHFRQLVALSSLGFALLLCLSGCDRSGPQHGPAPAAGADVVLITLDTTRQDRLGCYGRSEARTPHLDRLAETGARSPTPSPAVPITFPSHATIMSGVFPFVHGAHNNASFRMPEGVPTLATWLKSAGYRTGAFVSAIVLDAKFGLNRGFDEYD